MTLGERIRIARKAKQLSQAELANLIGAQSASVIGNWETDFSAPDADKLAMLADVLDVSGSYLLGIDYSGESRIDENDLSDEERVVLQIFRQQPSADAADGLMRVLEGYARSAPQAENDYLPNYMIGEGVIISENLFILDKKDPNFNVYKQKAKELRKLMKASYLSETDIRRYLYRIGYTWVTGAQIIAVIRGLRVPSPVFYDHIYRFLTGNLKISYPAIEQ